MSKIPVEKCDECGSIFEDAAKYEKHLHYHAAKKALETAFPIVKDKKCDFLNGGWSVKRNSDWLTAYKRTVKSIVGDDASGIPFSYGWFRYLDDGGHGFYGAACRVTNVCAVCFREWGQPFYANKCDHSPTKDAEP